MYSSLLVGLALTIAAPATKDKEPAKAASIVGTWESEKGTFGGMDLPVPAGGVVFTFGEDGKLDIREGKVERTDSGSYKIDAKKDPAEIDLMPPAGKNEPTIQGIYKLEGDTLVLAFTRGKPDAGRPTKFESPAGSEVMVITMKRVKK